MTSLPRIESRLFGVPLAIEAGKLAEITAVVADREGLLSTVARTRAAPRLAHSLSVIDGVAVLQMTGTLVKHTRGLSAMSGLTSYDAIARDFQEAMADPAVQSIMLHIDSNGGEVHGLFDLADQIFAARGVKPIWAAVDENAFSAAYVIASAADRIILPRTGGVGSLGVITQHVDQSARDVQEGLKFTTLFVGRHKNDGDPHEPLKPEAKARIMRELHRVHGILVETVARHRGLSEAAVAGTDADVFFGDAAIQAGLADGIATAQDVFSNLVGANGVRLDHIQARSPIMQTIKPTASAPAGATAAVEIIRACAAAQVPELAADLLERGLSLEQVQAEIAAVGGQRQEIGAMCALAGASERADRFIAEGFNLDQVRTVLFDSLAAQSEHSEISAHHPVSGHGATFDNPAFLREAMAEALMTRFDPNHNVPNHAREFVGMTLPELARSMLLRQGHRVVGMSSASVINAALHTTGDFPNLLGDFANKGLRKAYEAQPSGIKQVARQSTASDFKPQRRMAAGEFPQLQEVNEHGEFTYGTMGEETSSYVLKTYGRIFGITRQALVNDDLRALTDTSRRIAVAVAEFEAMQLATLINSNPALADTVAVFHADHGNLAGSGAAISVTTLSAGRQAMRSQKAVDGELHINAIPRFIVVGAAKETEAEQVVSQIQAATVSESNAPFTSLSVATDPRLTGDAWYLAASPASVDGIEYAYLSGGMGPQTATERPLDYDGVRIRVFEDFGCGWIDFRGWYKNPGN